MKTSTERIAPDRAKPALKLVKTHELNREQWLTVRKGGIGSSDAAAAVGLNPYKSQLELWLEKTGRDGNLPQTDPNDETSAGQAESIKRRWTLLPAWAWSTARSRSRMKTRPR